jgi:hypothetical protein
MPSTTTDAGAPAPLYSQTPVDERGNFHYQGDLHRQGETLASIAARVEQHLRALFPEARFAIRTETFSGGRKITAELLDTPEDLTSDEAREAFIVRVSDQIERFGFTRSNLLQDFHSCAFFCEVRVGQAYWSALAQRRGARNEVASVISLAAFKKQLQPGDRLKLIAGPSWHRAIGAVRTVKAVRSKDIEFEGPIYLELPRAAQFACDGEHVRIAIGTEREPDAHLLYHWEPRQAA